MRPAIPAATLILLREVVDGPPLILMTERSTALAFAGGALVFPGGRVEPDDEVLGAELAPDLPHAGARVAALRETLEEAGLLAAAGKADSPDLRTRLAAGEPFGALLAEAGVTLDLAALIPWSRWRPDLPHARVFDTHFFLGLAPDGEPDPDGTETTAAFWMTAADVLARIAAGQASAIFPTRRNLERLAVHDSVEALIVHARATPVATISPWVEVRDGVEVLCLPEGLGYPATTEPVATAFRG